MGWRGVIGYIITTVVGVLCGFYLGALLAVLYGFTRMSVRVE